MIRRTRVALAACVLVALAPLAACGDDDDAVPDVDERDDGCSDNDELVRHELVDAPAHDVDPGYADHDHRSGCRSEGGCRSAVPKSREGYIYAVSNYDAPDALDVLAQSTVRDGPSWALTVAEHGDCCGPTDGGHARTPTIPEIATVEGEVQLLDGPPATSRGDGLHDQRRRVYEPGGAPDGSDTVSTTRSSARRDRITFVLQDGAWKLETGTSLGVWRGVASVPPSEPLSTVVCAPSRALHALRRAPTSEGHPRASDSCHWARSRRGLRCDRRRSGGRRARAFGAALSVGEVHRSRGGYEPTGGAGASSRWSSETAIRDDPADWLAVVADDGDAVQAGLSEALPATRWSWVPDFVDVDALIASASQQVTAQVPSPAMDMNPEPSVGGIVNIGLWLAVADPGQVSITASVGPVWATVTARYRGHDVGLRQRRLGDV